VSYLFILSRAPHDPLMRPVIDMLFSAAAFGQQPNIVFCDAAATLLGDPSLIAAPFPLEQLSEFGAGEIYYLSGDDLELKDATLCLPAKPLTPEALQVLIQSSDCVQSF
jgi:sulfur relay (sulfurtransferase) DsrF/TusC family protein